MKLDMDLVRNILLEIEDKDTGNDSVIEIKMPHVNDETLNGHMRLLVKEEFIRALKRDNLNAKFARYTPVSLEWRGHELLDDIREQDVWDQTKESAEKLGSFSLDILSKLAKGFLKKKIKAHTDIDIDI